MKNDVMTWQKWTAVIALILLGTGIFAQPRFNFRNDSASQVLRNRSGWNNLNLTDEQQEKISALQEANQQEMADLRNDLAIKRAELQKLQSAEELNLNEINNKLDEIGQLTTEMAKKSYALEQDILNLLTEEQRSIYRSRSGRMPHGLRNWEFDMAPGWRRGQVLPNMAPGWFGGRTQPFMAPRMRMNPGRR